MDVIVKRDNQKRYQEKKAKKEKKEQEKKGKDDKKEEIPNDPNAWWNTNTFTPDMNKNSFVETSSFMILFSRYRLKYMNDNLPEITRLFENTLKLKLESDFKKGVFTVSTTNQTFDPFAIINGKNILDLMSKGCDFGVAKTILDAGISFDVIKLSRYCSNDEILKNRKQRLIGPNGSTMKAIELTTKCQLSLYAKYAVLVGPISSLNRAQKVVKETMENIHPVYNIKKLMVMQELEKDPSMAEKSWAEYLPKFEKTKSKTKATKKTLKKKDAYTPFPKPIEKSDVQKKIESGQYFLEEQKNRTKNNKQGKKRKLESNEKSSSEPAQKKRKKDE